MWSPQWNYQNVRARAYTNTHTRTQSKKKKPQTLVSCPSVSDADARAPSSYAAFDVSKAVIPLISLCETELPKRHPPISERVYTLCGISVL